MQEIIDLVSRKTLHRFSYVANFCWILQATRFNLPLLSYPDLPRPEWDLGTRLKLNPPRFTGLDSTDSYSP